MRNYKELFLLMAETVYIIGAIISLCLGIYNGIQGDFILGTYMLVLALVLDKCVDDLQRNREERKRQRSLQKFLDDQGVDIKAKDWRGKGSRP